MIRQGDRVTVLFHRFGLRLGLLLVCVSLFVACAGGRQRSGVIAGGEPVIANDAYLTGQVGGLERTDADSAVVNVDGQSFSRALHVTTRKKANQSNDTQMTIPIDRKVEKGDVLLASLWIRGAAKGGQAPAQIELLFERLVEPWTKSITQEVVSKKPSNEWKHVYAPFVAVESYAPGEAMVSLRFAVQQQTVEVGGLTVVDFGKTKALEDLTAFATDQNPMGNVNAKVDFSSPRQTLLGFGGDFCQPRYGTSEAMDVVGQYALDHLHVVHARVGFPLNNWNPQPGEFRDDAQAHATLLMLQGMTRRHIPTVLTIWEGPGWMLGGRPEQAGRVLDPSKYGVCIDAIVRFLKLARDKYGATVDNFSFNEADYGVNFKFTSKTIGDFVRKAGPQFEAAGLKTKFLVGDTAGGSEFADYATPLLTDPTVAPYLGPLAFHCWDGLSASVESYRAIAQVGRTYKKPVWCLEAGWDSGLWQAPNPWGTWENGLKTAMVYERTLRLTGASLMDYWTYEDNYPIVDKDGPKPYPVFFVIKQMEDVCAAGSHVVASSVSDESLQVLATSGPRNSQFGVLVINPKGPGSVVLVGLPPGATVRVTQSDKAAQAKSLGDRHVTASGKLSLQLPARSVITLVGSRK